MQLQQLRYVLEAADKKSFSAAAKSLFLSQPSLSQQIANLEQELGITLFIRHSKSVSLTDAGEQFVRSARRIVNQTEQLCDNMKKYRTLEKGTLKIGMLWIAGYLNLSRIITEYHCRYPSITYHLDVQGSSTLLRMLLSRDLQAAFIISCDQELSAEEFYCRRIMDDQYVAVISSENPLSRKEVLHFHDLESENIIMPARESAFRKDIEHIFALRGITPHVLCETSQSDLVMQLAAQNLAVGFSSRSIAQKLLTPGCRLIPLETELSRPIYYVTLKEFLEYPAVRSFTEFVEELFPVPVLT